MNELAQKVIDEQNKKYGWGWEVEALKATSSVVLSSLLLNAISPNKINEKIHIISTFVAVVPASILLFKMANVLLNPSDNIVLTEHEYDGKLQNEVVKTKVV